MAFRILSRLALLLCIALPASPHPQDRYWNWFPINTQHIENGKAVSRTSGLSFTFLQPPTDHVAVIAEVTDCGKSTQRKGTIDTDAHGVTLLSFPICSLDGFRVTRLTLDFGRGPFTIQAPEAGKRYGYR